MSSTDELLAPSVNYTIYHQKIWSSNHSHHKWVIGANKNFSSGYKMGLISFPFPSGC